MQAMPCWIDVFCRCYVVQLRISSGAVTCLQCLSSRLLLNLGCVIAVLHAVPRRTDAAAVRPAQLHSVRRRQLLFNCRPGRSNRQLRSRILLLQWRRFCILHSLSRRQLLPLPCDVSRDAVPRRQLLPHCQPHGSHSLHPRYVLRRPRPRCSDGQLRVRLLQQRRRCDVSLHEVRGRNVPGHGGAGLLQAMPFWLSLFEDCVADPRRLARTPSPLVQVLIDALQPSFVVRVGVTGAHLADVRTEPGLRSSRQRCC